MADHLHRCRRCGAAGEGDPDGLPAGWSVATEGDAVIRLCATCTRDHVRAIEAKLGEEWWE